MLLFFSFLLFPFFASLAYSKDKNVMYLGTKHSFHNHVLFSALPWCRERHCHPAERASSCGRASGALFSLCTTGSENRLWALSLFFWADDTLTLNWEHCPYPHGLRAEAALAWAHPTWDSDVAYVAPHGTLRAFQWQGFQQRPWALPVEANSIPGRCSLSKWECRF